MFGRLESNPGPPLKTEHINRQVEHIILLSGFGNRKGPEHIEEVAPLTSLRPLGLRRQPRSRYGPHDPPWTRRGRRKTGTTDRISRPEN